jgi:hypothetical protein
VIVVTEPAAWASDGVEQILRNCDRIAARRGGTPSVTGIVVNRLGRTRDANYWADELARVHRDLVVQPYVKLRAAVAEAAAQAVPVHTMTRSGASDAIAEFDMLASRLFQSMKAPPSEGIPADVESQETPPTQDLRSPTVSESTVAPPAVTGDPIGATALVPGFR